MADVLAKVCTGCHRVLPLDAFRKASKGKYGRDAKCKHCRNAYMKDYRKNPDIIERERIYHAERYKDPEYRLRLRLNAQKPERKAQKAKYKAKYSAINKEQIAEYMREYCKDERVKSLRKKAQSRHDERYFLKHGETRCAAKSRARNRTIRGNLSNRMSKRMSNALQRGKEGRSWKQFVPYSLDDLIRHIESRFVNGMSWSNRHLWHIDHIRPIASFNYTSPEDQQFKECWALDNLQPLWVKDNLKKSARMGGVSSLKA